MKVDLELIVTLCGNLCVCDDFVDHMVKAEFSENFTVFKLSRNALKPSVSILSVESTVFTFLLGDSTELDSRSFSRFTPQASSSIDKEEDWVSVSISKH